MSVKTVQSTVNRIHNVSLSSLPGIKRNKNVCVVESIATECDQDWDIIEMDTGKKFFVHRKYPSEVFNIGVVQKRVSSKLSCWDNEVVIQKHLYPVCDPENDKHGLAFTFDVNSNVVSNKMDSFWKTRRGKRFSKYVNYRKRREQIKKEFLHSS